jgi:hypothetical protein
MPGAARSGGMTLLWRHPRTAGRPGLNAKKNFMRDPRSLVSPGIPLNEGDVLMTQILWTRIPRCVGDAAGG